MVQIESMKSTKEKEITMRSLGLKKKIIIIALPIIALGLCVFFSPANAQPRAEQANELARIRAAIQAKGLKWTAGESSVSKMSKDQRRGLCGLKFTGKPNIDDEAAAAPEGLQSTPATFDWRESGIVTEVRDQGYCGSCWAFATVAAMESQLLLDGIPAGNDLSEEAVVACNFDNDACCGGYLDKACNYLTYTGTTDEDCLLYTSGLPPAPPEAPCLKTSCDDICPDWADRTQRLSGWSFVPNPLHRRFGVDNIKNSLFNNGPVVAGMLVYTDFFYYDGGIYEPSYGVLEGGHAVLIVGYGDGYWICKNSWGSDSTDEDGNGWGEDGYFRIKWGSCNIGMNAIETYYDAPECSINEHCSAGDICCNGQCITPACSSDSDCSDGEDCTTDTCSGGGTCDAECVHTWPTCGIQDGCCGPECNSDDIDCQTSCAEFKESCEVDEDCCAGLACVGKPGNRSCK